ncbi:hypothetical protein EP073_10490 [Geovibrio thiophilus]|uniref:Uncharacterized protein n=1 Tax=Geovibrio thiophilus TaxID=139438 RepID=A0A410K0L4_9BACT|nr:hypothetical protein [Geovibrio thiophilus]QAR33818.1 hypothetical protein EP073_10490 [Geovibrio thiophilus]
MKKLIFFIMLIFYGFSSAGASDVYDTLAQTAQNMRVEKSIAEKLAAETKKNGYSEESVRTLAGIVSAGKYGAPAKYAEKVLEGIAKKAPEKAVLRAVEQIRSRYETASRIARKTGISGSAEESVTDTIADAMTAGAGEQGLMKTAAVIAARKTDRDETAKASMMLYREMVRYGVSDLRASEIAEKSAQSLESGEIYRYRKHFMQQAAHADAESLAESMGHEMSGSGSHGSENSKHGGSSEGGSSGGGHDGGSGGGGGHGGNGKGGG